MNCINLSFVNFEPFEKFEIPVNISPCAVHWIVHFFFEENLDFGSIFLPKLYMICPFYDIDYAFF